MADGNAEELQTYFQLMNLNGAARVYQAAIKKGILDALLAAPADGGRISEACGTREGPTRLVLEVLRSMGLVEMLDGRYALLPVTRALLSGEYRTLGDPYWNHLTTFLESAAPVQRMDDTAQSEQHYLKQAKALAWMLAPSAAAAAKMLSIGEKRKGLQILDIGAGSGVWSLTMAAQDPQATVTAVDWPGVLQVAAGMAERLGVRGRLSMLPGNYHQVDFPVGAFDLAVLGNVTHLETPDGNERLFEKIAKSLQLGGELVIFDVFPGHPNGDLSCSLYSLGLALRTTSGAVHGKEALAASLSKAGFVEAGFHMIEAPPYTMGMLLARRNQPARGGR